MHSLSKALAVDLGPYGIRVNCVAAGNIETDITPFEFNVLAEQEGTTPKENERSQAESVALRRRGRGRCRRLSVFTAGRLRDRNRDSDRRGRSQRRGERGPFDTKVPTRSGG
jgi:NAD(P)-dependent dehydrogenase (short-subunit alcohol dehydrogenase family)